MYGFTIQHKFKYYGEWALKKAYTAVYINAYKLLNFESSVWTVAICISIMISIKTKWAYSDAVIIESDTWVIILMSSTMKSHLWTEKMTLVYLYHNAMHMDL